MKSGTSVRFKSALRCPFVGFLMVWSRKHTWNAPFYILITKYQMLYNVLSIWAGLRFFSISSPQWTYRISWLSPRNTTNGKLSLKFEHSSRQTHFGIYLLFYLNHTKHENCIKLHIELPHKIHNFTPDLSLISNERIMRSFLIDTFTHLA